MSGSSHDMVSGVNANAILPSINNAGGLTNAHSWPSAGPSSYFGHRHAVSAWQEGTGGDVFFSSHLPLDDLFTGHSHVSHTVSDSDLLIVGQLVQLNYAIAELGPE